MISAITDVSDATEDGLKALLRETRGARNPNLQVVITHASHVCSQHEPAFVWNSLHAFGPSITRNLITRVLTICQVKLTESTALKQKRFDLRSLSPALCNLRSLLFLLIFSDGVLLKA